MAESTHEVKPRGANERKLVRKIDFFILTFCCLSYFVNYLDRTNLNNAYVSGMKEELGFRGNQLNVINTVFTVGYIIGQIPSNLALHYVKPRYFFPTMMFIWAGLTMITASTHTPQAIMAIRFFQGLAEATTFVGTHYILGSWYTERELGKRSGIFTASGLAGTMIGGFIQSGIHASMDGRHGLSGWRWLFIIDGIITIPVALYGLLLFPDTPETTTAPYLTPEERSLAVSRLLSQTTEEDLESKPKVFTWSFVRIVLTSWEWWGFVILWIIAGETESFSSNALLALYMKSHPSMRGYAVSQLNNYPTGVPAVGIVSTLFWAALTDTLGGCRELVGYFIGVTGVATSAMILTAMHSANPGGGKATTVVFAAYYWAGTVYACQAVFFAWANDAMRGRAPVFRGVVLAGMNLGSNAVNAWWSIVFYGASMAPWFERGMYAMVATSVALSAWTAGLTYMIKRNKGRQILEDGETKGDASNKEAGVKSKGGVPWVHQSATDSVM
ncbi:major facilitator superfamily domain-containing protein [Immersiella caudata]|uniref:Major facilitator superfamily domain-containing protein n=1 Tax=Immersiella caudata TaxID=314043 RepID=A0AA39WSE4_9PEZI|nr:major facilitator superfamily domain-containing protein [Immersiella caudata]